MEVLAATQTPTDKQWFQGTADAVRQYAWLLSDIKNKNVEDVVILSGDHLYRMDYSDFVKTHRSTNVRLRTVRPFKDWVARFALLLSRALYLRLALLDVRARC